jgi:hypothetical protein
MLPPERDRIDVLVALALLAAAIVGGLVVFP